MTTTVYGSPVRERLGTAQYDLAAHSASVFTGRCLSCGGPGPCVTWMAAATAFEVSGALPRRVPGATYRIPVHASDEDFAWLPDPVGFHAIE